MENRYKREITYHSNKQKKNKYRTLDHCQLISLLEQCARNEQLNISAHTI